MPIGKAAALLISLAISAGSTAAQYALAPRPKSKPIDRGRLDDLRVQTSDYGAFIPRFWGLSRTAGNIVFHNGFQEYVSTTRTGGKKTRQTTNDYSYLTSFAIMLARNPILQFKRIWADSEIFIAGTAQETESSLEAEDATLAGGANIVTDSGASNGEYVTNIGNGGTVTYDLEGSALVPPEPPGTNTVPHTRISFYYKCTSTLNAVIETVSVEEGTVSTTIPFVNTENDWSVKTVNFDGYVTDLEFANPSADAPDLDKIAFTYYYTIDDNPIPELNYNISGIIDPTIIYPLDLDDPSQYYNYKPTADGDGVMSITTAVPSQQVRLYTGTATQTPDSAYITYLDLPYSGNGADYATAWRGHTVMFVENYVLKDGRIANFTAELDQGTNTANAVMEDLFAELRLETSDYDLTATEDLIQTGFYNTSQTTYRQLFDALQKWHFFNLVEIGGVVTSVLENADSIADIDTANLRAHNESEEYPVSDYVITLKEESTLLPYQVDVGFIDYNFDFKNNSVSSQAIFDTQSNAKDENNFPIVAVSSEAKLVADKTVKKAYAENRTIEFSALPAMAKYCAGDVLTVEIEGVEQKVKVDKVNYAIPSGAVKFTCSTVEDSVFETSDEESRTELDATDGFKFYGFPRNSIAVAIQSEPIFEADKGRLGIYLGISGRGLGDWQVAGLYRERAEDNYELVENIANPSPVGKAQDTLTTHSPLSSEDTTNEIDIYFYDEIELESVTLAELERYPTLNLIRIGDEWLQFRTATAITLPANSTYRSAWKIENLWRGKFGTASTVGSHSADEYATLATNALYFYELEREDIGEDINIKAVTNGQSVDVAPVTSFTFAPIYQYAVSNVSERRTFDANATTINELADTLGTLIEDLNR